MMRAPRGICSPVKPADPALLYQLIPGLWLRRQIHHLHFARHTRLIAPQALGGVHGLVCQKEQLSWLTSMGGIAGNPQRAAQRIASCSWTQQLDGPAHL